MADDNHNTLRSTYYNELSTDAKKRYDEKLTIQNEGYSFPDPYALKDGWSDEPDSWPDLNFGHIFMYLIDTPGVYTKEALQAHKSLDAYKFVVSGHVHTVQCQQIKDTDYFLLKTKVIPSQRINDKPHEPWVCLATSGSVICGHCTCMAGLGEVCSHVAALLFKVEIGVKLGLNKSSSTSLACQWNKAFRKKVEPLEIEKIHEVGKSKRKPTPNVISTGNDELPSVDMLKSLKAVCPDAVFWTLIPLLPSEDPEHKEDVQSSLPKTLESLYDPTDIPSEDEMWNVWNKYICTDQHKEKLEKITRNQAISKSWFEHRRGRITGTKAHDVLTRKEKTVADNLVRSVMGYDSYDLSKNKAVQWGVKNEEVAKQVYSSSQQTVHTNFKMRETGFKIHNTVHFVGASADGITSCDCCGTGTLEVKCPYKHREVEACVAAQKDKDFCLDTKLNLKKGHRYYTQIQLQMEVHGVAFCDFVVLTKTLSIQRIYCDKNFISRLLDKCSVFFKNHVLPELLTRKLQNCIHAVKRKDAVNKKDSDDESETWCLCGEPAYGRMIKCDGDDCPNIWYHYKCV